MPLITVYGLSKWSPHTMIKDLRDACLNVKELGLTDRKDVTIYPVASDSISTDSGPIIIIVELLFDRPERTHEIRQKLAEALGQAAKISSPNRSVEVAVKRFNTEKDAFWAG